MIPSGCRTRSSLSIQAISKKRRRDLLLAAGPGPALSNLQQSSNIKFAMAVENEVQIVRWSGIMDGRADVNLLLLLLLRPFPHRRFHSLVNGNDSIYQLNWNSPLNSNQSNSVSVSSIFLSVCVFFVILWPSGGINGAHKFHAPSLPPSLPPFHPCQIPWCGRWLNNGADDDNSTRMGWWMKRRFGSRFPRTEQGIDQVSLGDSLLSARQNKTTKKWKKIMK